MKSISITKPGIIFGNIVTVSGGFFLGSVYQFHFLLYLITLIGMACVIACGCVLNNVVDRDIDQLMERTKDRILAKGLMSGQLAVLYAVVLGVVGSLLLYFYVNGLTMCMALVGLFFYVCVYTLCLKRKSVYGTLIGGISGAMPPVVGYCAATNRFDAGAIILFFILFLWQMPHFYAIAIYRLQDFKAASLPVLPLRKSIRYTKFSMLVYVVLFTIAAIMPSLFCYTGIFYFIVALFLGVTWFYFGLKGFTTKADRLWARKMFLFSILVITLLSLAMAVKS